MDINIPIQTRVGTQRSSASPNMKVFFTVTGCLLASFASSAGDASTPASTGKPSSEIGGTKPPRLRPPPIYKLPINNLFRQAYNSKRSLPDSHTAPIDRSGLFIRKEIGAGDPDASSSSGALRAPELGQASRTPARFARRLPRQVVPSCYNDVFEFLRIFFDVFSANLASCFVNFCPVKLIYRNVLSKKSLYIWLAGLKWNCHFVHTSI